jgi:hypothetical protein
MVVIFYLWLLLVSGYGYKKDRTPFWNHLHLSCHNPTLREAWGRHSHSRKWDLGVLWDSHWDVIYTVGNLLKCRCSKWPRMSHLDICSISYGWKKGRESNWQLDSPPLKVGTRPDLGVCKWSATHHRKAFKESYKFALDLVSIGVWGKKLWTPKVPGAQTGTILGLHFGSPGKKCHSDASATERHREYYMGEGGGFPRVRAVVSQVSPRLPVACPNTKSVPNEY